VGRGMPGGGGRLAGSEVSQVTVIAWDGKTLAADKQSTNQGHASMVTKIYRSGDDLVAICGGLARGMAMRRWYEAGRDSATFPKPADADDFAILLVVHRDGTVDKYESMEHPLHIESPYCATGSGRDFALLAMHLGYDARRAVELACELSVDCGMGIDTLTFTDGPGE